MNAIAIHMRVRLQAIFSEPLTAVILLFSSLTTLLVWPGPSDPSGAGWVADGETRVYAVLQIVLIWMFLWPILVSRASGRMAGQMHHLAVMPTLPIGFRARAFAEAIAVLLAVLVSRVVGVFLVDVICQAFGLPRQPISEGAYWLEFARHSLCGALLMLPLLIACASPAPNMGVYWVRPLVWVGLLFAVLKLGLITTPAGCTGISLVLTGLALAIAGREFPVRRLVNGSIPAMQTRWRPPLNPERQLRHDQWTRPFECVWPVVGTAVVFQVAVVLVNHWYALPRYSFYLGTTLTASTLFGTLVLRPLGSVQATASFKGAPGYRHGDFMAAWSVLPVRREAVLRGVFVHGLITGTLVWTLVIAANYWANWLAVGELCLIDQDGDRIGWILWPAYVIVPCVAGFLTAGAVGNSPLAFLSFGSAIAYLPVRIIFWREFSLPDEAAVGLILLIAVVGAIPAFLYLRKPRARPYERLAAHSQASI